VKWVLASSNAGKLEEIRAILADAGIELVAQSALGIDDAEETGATFVENALIKARHAARRSGLPALADDSGLCVAALGGAPGLRSARYAGRHGDSAANIAHLLDALREVPPERRAAHFHCTIVLLNAPDDPAPLIAEGRWHGSILAAPRGSGGHGYDPVFLDPASGLSAAELPPAAKNVVSHRARAFAQMRRALAGAG
jgi:XTP/dITP diphosphohydrolase